MLDCERNGTVSLVQFYHCTARFTHQRSCVGKAKIPHKKPDGAWVFERRNRRWQSSAANPGSPPRNAPRKDDGGDDDDATKRHARHVMPGAQVILDVRDPAQKFRCHVTAPPRKPFFANQARSECKGHAVTLSIDTKCNVNVIPGIVIVDRQDSFPSGPPLHNPNNVDAAELDRIAAALKAAIARPECSPRPI
jgi:hypothetical protein